MWSDPYLLMRPVAIIEGNNNRCFIASNIVVQYRGVVYGWELLHNGFSCWCHENAWSTWCIMSLSCRRELSKVIHWSHRYSGVFDTRASVATVVDSGHWHQSICSLRFRILPIGYLLLPGWNDWLLMCYSKFLYPPCTLSQIFKKLSNQISCELNSILNGYWTMKRNKLKQLVCDKKKVLQ